MRTVRSNQGLKLTRPDQVGASQLNPSVLRTIGEGGRQACRSVQLAC